MAAGLNTTTDALSYAIYHLAGHPEKLQAAQAEVDAAGPDFCPTLENLERLPYLDACFRLGMPSVLDFPGQPKKTLRLARCLSSVISTAVSCMIEL